ncbi:MAG: tRNA 2-thiouridine(34) synthase MnmA [Desulfobacterales bacterium]
MPKQNTRITVGLSGGVDSSVAAALLKDQDYDVTGITMEIFDGSVEIQETGKHACYGPGEQEDIETAASICKKLDIPFHVIDLKKEYRLHVIDYFKQAYLAGTTPNPCVVCNQKLKFGFLLEKARDIGIQFDAFATGHYAQIVEYNGRHVLKKAADPFKDQTYFLYMLTSDQLSHTRFPLGAYTKQETRKIARRLGLETANRIESQDFIAGGDYTALFDGMEFSEGDIVDESGSVLGKHRGIVHYTLGQRHGLGIAADRPLYVLKIDPENNRIVAGGKEQLFSAGLIASDLNLTGLEELDRSYDIKAKIRLNHNEVDAVVSPHERGKAHIRFREPQMAITPGQSVVMYSNDIVLGGGIIEKVIPLADK